MNPAQRIREFILSGLLTFDDNAVLNDDDNIFELGFLDSLFALELVTFIEKEFEIEMRDEDLILSNFSSVNAVVRFLNSKRNV